MKAKNLRKVLHKVLCDHRLLKRGSKREPLDFPFMSSKQNRSTYADGVYQSENQVWNQVLHRKFGFLLNPFEWWFFASFF